jgi:AcrR family transcriptional regulator
MTKIRQSPKLPAEKRRQQLLESAHALFLKKGLRATSMDEIAHNAGLTKGALYFHFTNKEDILFELIKSIATGYRQAMEALPHGELHAHHIIEASLKYKGRGRLKDFRGMVEIWMQALSVPRIKRFVNEEFRAHVEHLASGWDPALGYDKATSKQVAIAVLCLADGLAAHRCLDESLIKASSQLQMIRGLSERVILGSGKNSAIKPRGVTK